MIYRIKGQRYGKPMKLSNFLSFFIKKRSKSAENDIRKQLISDQIIEVFSQNRLGEAQL